MCPKTILIGRKKKKNNRKRNFLFSPDSLQPGKNNKSIQGLK